MMTRRNVVFAAVLGAAIAFAAPVMAARTASGPDEFIRTIGKEAIESLTAKDLTESERQRRFRKLLNRAFDMRTIARFTLGRYWRLASKKQREEYVALFEDFIVQAYASRFGKYSGETFKVGRVRVVNDRDRLVESEIERNGQPPVRIHWRVRGNGKYKIVDVVVEGVSMGITQRDEFAAVIRNNGGKIEGLLTALRKKTSRARN